MLIWTWMYRRHTGTLGQCNKVKKGCETAVPIPAADAGMNDIDESKCVPRAPMCCEERPGYILPPTDDPLWDSDPGHDKVLARLIAGLPRVFNLELLSSRRFHQRAKRWGTWDHRKERALFALHVGRKLGLWSYYALAPNRHHFWVRHNA